MPPKPHQLFHHNYFRGDKKELRSLTLGENLWTFHVMRSQLDGQQAFLSLPTQVHGVDYFSSNQNNCPCDSSLSREEGYSSNASISVSFFPSPRTPCKIFTRFAILKLLIPNSEFPFLTYYLQCSGCFHLMVK